MCSCNDTRGVQATVNQSCLLPMDPLGDTPLTRTSWWVPSVHRADKVRDLKGDAHLCPEQHHTLIIQLGESAEIKKKVMQLSLEKQTSVLAVHTDCPPGTRFQKYDDLSKTVSKGRMANLILSLALMNYSLCSSPRAQDTLFNTL